MCCAKAKICIKRCSDLQVTCKGHQIANCNPVCKDGMNQETCTCEHSDFPAKWGSSTCTGKIDEIYFHDKDT